MLVHNTIFFTEGTPPGQSQVQILMYFKGLKVGKTVYLLNIYRNGDWDTIMVVYFFSF